MPATHCAVPGCNYRRQSSEKGLGLFTVRRPEAARNEEQRHHRDLLKKFLLSVRDEKKDGIRGMLHREMAAICEQHFQEADIIRSGKLTRLRVGAVPCKSLPKRMSSVFATPRRKPPTIRKKPTPKKIYSSSTQFFKAATNIEKKTAKWMFYHRNEKVIGIQEGEERIGLAPRIRVTFDVGVGIDQLYIFGWPVESSLIDLDILCTPLSITIKQLDNLKLCNGVGQRYEDTKIHPIVERQHNNLNLSIHEIHRSPKCKVVVNMACDENVCEECEAYLGLGTSRTELQDEVVEVDEAMHSVVMDMANSEGGKMNDFLQQLFLDNVKNSSRSGNGRRYHPDVLRWCIELYSRSPAAYNHIRSSEVLQLPSNRTIRSYRNCVPTEPGINSLALQQISSQKTAGENMIGFICLDEMKIKENLVLREGKLVGLVDAKTVIEIDTNNELANSILVFYARTVTRKVSTPIAWYPTKSIAAARLAALVQRIVVVCEVAGLEVHAVICDGHPTNRKMFRIISQSHKIELNSTLTANNPIAPNRPIFLLSDTPHLLKTTRNSLLSSRNGGSKFMTDEKDRPILWTHVASLYKKESKSLLSESLLKKCHIELTPYSKMKVNLACGVMNERVGKVLGQNAEAKGTADFILMISKWFSIVNSSPGNPLRSADDPRIAWLETFADGLQSWQTYVNQKYDDSNKRLIALPTLEGLCFTSRNLALLARRILNSGQLDYLGLHSFSQDVLEAFFGNVRQHGAYCSNPDVSQAAQAIQHSTVRKYVKKIKGGNTTYGTRNAWQELNNEPLLKRPKAEKAPGELH